MAKLLNWTLVTGMALLAVMIVVKTLNEISGPAAQLQMVRRPTMAQYHLLEDGMSYAAAVDVIGAEGAEVSRTASGVTAVTYEWVVRGSDAHVSATFEEDRLVSKDQVGLR